MQNEDFDNTWICDLRQVLLVDDF